jgi:hypothetical protein
MRTMLDAVAPDHIPLTADMVAGYVDGYLSTWPWSGWMRFAGHVRVAIAVSPTCDNGHVLDVERYDALPEQAPGWVLLRRAHGCDPSVYVGMANWADCRSAFHAAGVAEPHWWVADWTGLPHTPPGAVACQWKSGPLFDTSQVADFWPGVDNGQTWPDDVARIVRHPVAAVPVLPTLPDILARLAQPVGSAAGYATDAAWEAARADFLRAVGA